MTDVVQGTGGLIIAVIIVLVIVSTLFAANLFATSDVSSVVTNQTVSVDDAEEGTNFGNHTQRGATCSLIVVTNATNEEVVVEATNYTVSGCTIIAVDGTNYNDTNWNVSSRTVYNGMDENSATDMKSNFTVGIDNVSSKLPTILLIAAVVLLFGVLVLLVARSRQMGIGGGTSL